MCGRYVSPTMAEIERYWALSDARRNNQLGFSRQQVRDIRAGRELQQEPLDDDGFLEAVGPDGDGEKNLTHPTLRHPFADDVAAERKQWLGGCDLHDEEK